MILYHMSQTLRIGEQLQADYLKKAERYQPYIQALKKGENRIFDLIEHEDKGGAVSWSDIVKRCVEGVFEYIRETEFTQIPSRLNSSFYFDCLAHFGILYQAGWAQEPAEIQAQIHLFEIEIAEEHPHKFDMCIFDEAYDAMLERQDLRFILDSARRYFSGQHTLAPVWEIMSDKPARAVRDITRALKCG